MKHECFILLSTIMWALSRFYSDTFTNQFSDPRLSLHLLDMPPCSTVCRHLCNLLAGAKTHCCAKSDNFFQFFFALSSSSLSTHSFQDKDAWVGLHRQDKRWNDLLDVWICWMVKISKSHSECLQTSAFYPS